MVLAGRSHQQPQPVPVWRRPHRPVMGPHCCPLRHQVGPHSPPLPFNLICQFLKQHFSIVRAGDAIYVRVGDHDLTQKFGSPGAQTLRVATTYIHHNHNSQTLDNDIALLKLHGDAELKEGVCLVSFCKLKARACVMPLYRSAYQPGGQARLRGKSAQSRDTATWEKVSYHWALVIEVGMLFGAVTGHLSPSVRRA